MSPADGESVRGVAAPVRGLCVLEIEGRAEVGWVVDGEAIRLRATPDRLPAYFSAFHAPVDLEGMERIPSPEYLPPLAPGARVIAVAQNYPAHAAEAGGDSPPSPIMFMKPHSAFLGHDQTCRIPAVTTALDYEAELAVVIGRSTSAASRADAVRAIAGVTLANDGSARDLQPATLAGKPIVDWFSAKSLDACSALGPVIVPASDLGGFGAIRLEGVLNGDVVQSDVTSSMHLDPVAIVEFISHRLTLLPADVILTGTPAGVGKARGRLLRDGDSFTVRAEGLGELTTRYRESPVSW